MSTAEYDLSGYRRRDVWLWKLAHRAPATYLAITAIYVVHDVLGLFDIVDKKNPMAGLFITTIASVALVFIAAHGLHSGVWHTLFRNLHRKIPNLCGLCAAMTPLDGQAAAAKHDRQLRVHHSIQLRLLIILAMFLNGAVSITLNSLYDTPLGISILAQDLCFMALAVFMHIEITHTLVAPWCPYCRRRRRRDDDDETPPPDLPEDHGADHDYKSKVS